jgi:hypothetical protein
MGLAESGDKECPHFDVSIRIRFFTRSRATLLDQGTGFEPHLRLNYFGIRHCGASREAAVRRCGPHLGDEMNSGLDADLRRDDIVAHVFDSPCSEVTGAIYRESGGHRQRDSYVPVVAEGQWTLPDARTIHHIE